jgi:CO dehydrogenase/acetyl-CoA synthase alpha subunit
VTFSVSFVFVDKAGIGRTLLQKLLLQVGNQSGIKLGSSIACVCPVVKALFGSEELDDVPE